MKQTKELILKTAKKLFARNGLTKTTMDDVAKDARIGKGTIYHYFESKEQMYCQIIEDDMSIIKEELISSMAAEAEPDKKLTAYFMNRMKSMLKFSAFYSMFKQDYVDYYGYIRKAYEKYQDFEMNSIRQCLKDGADKGLFNVADLEFTTYAIVQGIKGMEYYFATEKPEELERKVNILMDIALRGLLKNK
jgi:AcrR family transcriptional regulator